MKSMSHRLQTAIVDHLIPMDLPLFLLAQVLQMWEELQIKLPVD